MRKTILCMLLVATFFYVVFATILLTSIAPLSRASAAPPSPGRSHNVAQLFPADPSWGAPIPGSWGCIKYFQTADDFKGEVHLRGLLPNHEYTFCINGKPGMPGTPAEYMAAGISFYDESQGKWTTPGGSWGAEEFCDFWLITTNNAGDWSGSFKKTLPIGDYDVKFFVKDAHAWDIYQETGQWKTIVLYNNDVEFTIQA